MQIVAWVKCLYVYFTAVTFSSRALGLGESLGHYLSYIDFYYAMNVAACVYAINSAVCMLWIQLYDRRKRVVQTEEEQIAWDQLSGDYMTEESENEDGVIYYHKLTWTSESMITFFTGHISWLLY